MKSTFRCFIFSMIMMTSLVFAGNVYYVDATNGNDSNSGTSPSNAWKTVRKLNSTYFNPSDTIKFKKGETWREKLTVPSSGSSGQPITFTSYGTGNKPKLLMSAAMNSTGDWTNESGNLWYASSVTEVLNMIYDSESSEAIMVENKGDLDTQGEAWWDSSNSIIYVYSTSNPATDYNGIIELALKDNAIDVNDKAYITIDGIDIRYVGNHGIYAVHSVTGSNLTVQNCNFKFISSNLFGDTHTYGRSIRADIYNNSRFLNNTFEYTANAINCRSDGTAWVVTIDGNTVSNMHGYDPNSDAINFGGTHADYSGSVVSNNDISGFRDDGIDLYYASNVIVRNNTVHDIATGTTGDGNGIKCGGVVGAVHSTGNQIVRNLIYNINYGTHKTAIHGNGCENVLVAYNIAYDCDEGYVDGSLDANGAFDNPQIYNNTFVQMANMSIHLNGGIDTDNRKAATVANNICDATTADISISDWVNCGGGYNCLVNDASVFDRANANYTGTSDLDSTDPLFVDASNNDFRLKPSSLCIDAGTYVGLTEDYAGHTVPYGGVVDIGAYEYIGDNPLNAEINASPASGEVPLTVNFTGSATGGVLPYSYSWDFGDGTSSSEQTPIHTYSQASDYTVTLTVNDNDSNQNEDSVIINALIDEAYLSCSPTSLYFGATTPGNETTDKYLRIINAGSGVLTWNIEDDADWLSCSPSSGTDRGEITVSVNASGLSLGRYTATITVSSPKAYNSPQYVSVNFRIYEPEQESPPFRTLDTAVDGSTVSGSIPVTGRALDDDEIGARYFFIDNVETGSAQQGSFRLRSIYREDAEERLRVGIKEVKRGYRPQADDDQEIATKSILKIQIEEMEPLRIVLEERSKGNIKYIGWGENEWKALPVGSTLDREKGIFLWIPAPGFIGRYVLHFAVTDGSYRSKPLRVVVNVIPKKDRNKENL